ncbi:MFS transporter [Leucobacter sp. NPDC058333]|uniref:MFS transporter n=1 Tax=Leucobacter sp. NPDC058333 TaxID=3346450 RepID=UPI00364CD21C
MTESQSRTSSPTVAASQRALQRRSVAVLALATVLGGLGVGASLSAGALLITDVTGNPALSGFGSTMNAVGAAIAGIPLARLAARRGRRVALATGNLTAVAGAVIVILAAGIEASPLLFVGLALLGIAAAVQLQARFAATDLAIPANRARDLSLVVWSITVGAVIGPNLIGPGEKLGAALGLHALSGIFVFAIVAQIAAGLVVWLGLRPDPLLEARRIATQAEASAAAEVAAAAARAAADPAPPVSQPAPTPSAEFAALDPSSRAPQFLAIALVALGHAVMVGIMAMTPLHLTHHGGSIELVGITISLHIAGMYALSPLAGIAASRIGAVPVVIAGFAVLALAAIGTALAGDSVPVVQVSLVLLGLGWCMVTVAGATLVTSLTPVADRPARQGQADTTMNAAGAVFGAVSGVLFAVGGFPVLSSVAGALIVVGIAVTVRLGALAQR